MNRLIFSETTTDDINTRVHVMPASDNYNLDLTKTVNSMIVYKGADHLGDFIVDASGDDVSFGLDHFRNYGTGTFKLKLLVQTEEQKYYFPSGDSWVQLSVAVDNTGKVSLTSLDDQTINSVYRVNQNTNNIYNNQNNSKESSKGVTLDYFNPQLIVGSVKELPTGSKPTVTLVKNQDSNSLTINFGIPTGLTGERGTKIWKCTNTKVTIPIVGSWFTNLDNVTKDNLPKVGDLVILGGKLVQIVLIKDTTDGNILHGTFNTDSNAITLPKGDSAYKVWLNQGNSGTEADFLASLKGPKGDNWTEADKQVILDEVKKELDAKLADAYKKAYKDFDDYFSNAKF